MCTVYIYGICDCHIVVYFVLYFSVFSAYVANKRLH